MKANMPSSTRTLYVKFLPNVMETLYPEQTVVAELGEKTPRERSFSLDPDGDAESLCHTYTQTHGREMFEAAMVVAIATKSRYLALL